MWRRRLAGQLSISFMLLFMVTFGTMAAVTLYYAHRTSETSVDSSLLALAQTVDAQLGQEDPSLVVADHTTAAQFIQLRDVNGNVLVHSSNLGAAALPLGRLRIPLQQPTYRTAHLNKSTVRVIVFPRFQDGNLVGYIDAANLAPEFESSMNRVITVSAVAAITGTLLTVAGTLWLARRVTRPITELAERVSAAAASGFEEDVEPPSGGSIETQQLGAAIHDLVRRQREQIYRERAFFADSSHVLRTPLAVLQGNVEVLEEDVPDTERQEAIDHIRTALDTMKRVVSRLLLLARESEPPGQTWEVVSLSELLDHLVHDARTASRHIDVEADIAPALEIAGDRTQLNDMFASVIENSCQYTPAGGHIAVSAHRNGEGTAVVEVRDTGIGLGTEESARATERLYRGTTARRMFPGGAGLGLAIATRIALMHQGSLTLEPGAERGAVARITLPLL